MLSAGGSLTMTFRTELVLLVVWLGVTCAAAIGSAAIAERKGRSAAWFFVLGLVFSVIGVVFALVASPRSRTGATLPAKLADLKRRHAAGELTDEELAAARTELLGG
jgi:hypothetical protein